MQEMQKMQVRSLGQEDPLEKEMATHSSFLAWETPWKEEPGGLTGEFFQIFKKEILILYNLLQRMEAEWIFPNSFYEISTTLIRKKKKFLRNNNY